MMDSYGQFLNRRGTIKARLIKMTGGATVYMYRRSYAMTGRWTWTTEIYGFPTISR